MTLEVLNQKMSKALKVKPFLESERNIIKSYNYGVYPLLGVRVDAKTLEVKIRDSRKEIFKIKDNSLSLSLNLLDKILILPLLAKWKHLKKFKKLEKFLLKNKYIISKVDTNNNEIIYEIKG